SNRGHYPAIDPLESISRLMPDICSAEHVNAANQLRRLLGVYAENEDLISVGAYQEGNNPEIDRAVRLKPAIDAWLCQRTDEPSTFDEALGGLMALASAE
ncbi:MAG: EscN/YscN/HrcN family type III secretion system ATPase, partial [Thermoguttaceae bacterium]|nr:EscN/YscN/HrcN family type III secretion system ATPase [Thermoguttaceae bacterium]